MARSNNRKSTALVPVEQPAAPEPAPAQPTGRGRGRKPAAPAESGPPAPAPKGTGSPTPGVEQPTPQATPRPRRGRARPEPVSTPPPAVAQPQPLHDVIAVASKELEELRRQSRAAHAEWVQEAREQARTLHAGFVDAQRQLSEAVQLQVQQLRQLLQLLQQLPQEVNGARQQLRQLPEEIHALRQQLQGLQQLPAEVNGLRQQLQELRQQLPETMRQTQEIRQELQRVQRHVRETREEVKDVKQEIQEVVPQPAPAPTVPPVEGRNRLGLTVAPGVVVAEVQSDSPGALAGLARGDVVAAVNGQPVRSAAQLRTLIHEAAHEKEMTLQVARRGTATEIKLHYEGGPAEAPAEGQDRLGVTVDPGVVVDEVAPGTPAAGAGLTRGDVILALNDVPVLSGEELRLAVHQCAPGEEVTLQVARGGEPREVKARLDEPAPTPSTP